LPVRCVDNLIKYVPWAFRIRELIFRMERYETIVAMVICQQKHRKMKKRKRNFIRHFSLTKWVYRHILIKALS